MAYDLLAESRAGAPWTRSSVMKIVVLLVALAACSKRKSEPAGGGAASCQASASLTCEDYEASSKPYLEGRGKECKQIGGTWATTACPTADLVGSCREKTASWTRTRHYYAGANVELARAEAECGAYGTWLAPAKP